MKIRRLTAATLSVLALTVAAPATANAFTLVDLLPKGVADLIPSGSWNPFAPPAPPAPPAPHEAPAPQQPAPAPAPAPQQSAPAPTPRSAPSGGFKNCTEAWNAGAAPVYRDDPGYAPRLDRDNDGIGCERDPR
ncbi:excalibur calcium-binding domain-containing protein [Rhodococcus artemisiae]|uniref:Excalibur calcium-binding domain-containing protein n=1 Tax=Rhodococcus artemisiae TaxID=714159 RepID=A0ABU7LIT4_9NOCA|nr:excalibur calcium-binding domain-containing protein [Rhodococcus artemisiae]MEE2061421.1 excalibur calcium-binding domain-containing protein [Rhodococcus artemisiae]